MNGWMNIIYALLLYPILPVMYIQLRNETKPKKNIIMGVTLPYSALSRAETAELSDSCRKSLFRTFLLLHIPFLLCFIAEKYVSVLFGALMVWLLLALGVYYVVYVRCHQRFRDYKRSLLPTEDTNTPAPVQVDPEAIVKSAPRGKLYYYIPPFIISLSPLFFELLQSPRKIDIYGVVMECVIIALCILIFALTDYVLRRRSEAISSDSAVNTALTQARRGHWSRCSLWISYLTALLGVMIYISLRTELPELVLLSASLIYSFAVIFIAVRTDLACRHAQERLAGALSDAADTDRYWILGMFYYNKQDSHNLVHSRTGTNSSFNLARPLGKLMMGFCALCILSIPVLAAHMIQQELTPISVTMQDDSLHIDHVTAHKVLPLEDITGVETLDVLPANSRVNGTGLPTLLEGRFSMRDYTEPCWFCLDPRDAPFVTFVCDGVRYVLNASALDGLQGFPQA